MARIASKSNKARIREKLGGSTAQYKIRHRDEIHRRFIGLRSRVKGTCHMRHWLEQNMSTVFDVLAFANKSYTITYHHLP